MPEPISRLECISCQKQYDTEEVRYLCDCGDLLQVVHDLEKLRHEYPNIKETFHKRLQTFEPPYCSGVWRYHEIILPQLKPSEIVTKPEGNTNLYRSPKLSSAFELDSLYLKHEGENPTLSFKDRGMTAGVSWANHLGMKIVACASTGDTSAAMAAYAAQVENIKGVVFLPHNKISPEQLAQSICYGALTLAIDTDFDGCMKLVKEVCKKHPIYLLNSMNSFRIEGQKSIGIEAIQQMNWKVPDWIIIPIGNAGNISALGKGLKEAYSLGIIDRLPRIAGVQAASAQPFYESFLTNFEKKVTLTAQPTLASAIRIGSPVSHDKASRIVQDFDGVVTSVSEAELMDAKAIADRCGVAVCPNSGVALAGLRKLLKENTIEKHQSALCILTAHGAKFSQISVEYHLGQIKNLLPSHPNPFIEVEPNLDGIVKVLSQSGNI